MLATADESTREQRLREGLCPACGTRLYKVVRKGGIATVKTLFNKKDTTANSAADVKMIPLTLPGVVERGQCMKCSGHEVAIGAASSVPPAVKAVPVVVRSPAAAYAAAAQGDDDQDLLCMLEAEAANPDSLHNSDHKFSKSDRSCSMYSTDTEYEDVPLLDIANMDLRDPFSSSMKYDKSESTGEDHPDFLVAIPDASLESYFEPKQEVDKSVERIQRLREEAQDWSQALGVASVAAAIPSKPQALDCPDGMSPDVFYQLPPEVQKEVSQSGAQSLGASLADIDPDTLASLPESVRREVMEQTSASSRGNSEKQVAFAPEKITVRKTNHLDRKPLSKSTKVFLEEYDIKEDDFDALDEDVQKDLLGIKASQKQKETIDCSDRSDKMGRSNLSKSTKDFLSGFDINEHDFNDFDEEVKSDLLREKQRSSLSTSVSSTYDPETLASLPEDLRNEVLNQEKREKEQQQQKNREDRRAVGAHSVNVPAGYDPDTFEALPLEVQQELMDAAQNGVVYAADGYEYDSIVRAPIVEATSVGQERATYEGDYNSAGKRHGEGTLEWANGDVYVGRFRNGFIDGTGTITFHDGKFNETMTCEYCHLY
jgi:hypothetical protein